MRLNLKVSIIVSKDPNNIYRRNPFGGPDLYMRTYRHDEASWHIAATSCAHVKESKVIPVLKEATLYGNDWNYASSNLTLDMGETLAVHSRGKNSL
jgi:hypothetical protein